MIYKNELHLLEDIQLDPNYQYTIDFDNKIMQNNYFDSKISNIVEEDDYTYLRNGEGIKVFKNKELLGNINYLYYINENGRRMYAFITSKDYVDDTTTLLNIKIDLLQSYMFDYEINECFIEREHEDRFIDNKPIYNTIPEDLNYGEKYELKSRDYVRTNDITEPFGDTQYKKYQEGYFVIISTKKLEGDTSPEAIGNYYSNPFFAYAFPSVESQFFDNVTNELVKRTYGPAINYDVFLNTIGSPDSEAIICKPFSDISQSNEFKDGKSIVACYFTTAISANVEFTLWQDAIPQFKVSNRQILKLHYGEKDVVNVPAIRLFGFSRKFFTAIPKKINFKYDLTFNDLKDIYNEPKLYINPYYYYALENDSTPFILQNEYLPDNIEIESNIIESVQPKVNYHIKGYLKDNENEELIDNTIKDLPILTNEYLAYMLQNKAAATTGVALNLGSSLINFGVGAATGGFGLAVGVSEGLSIANEIAKEMVMRKDLKQQPNNINAVGNNGMFSIASRRNNLRLSAYGITDEYKKRLANYFYHYGYKCNDFKKPNTRSRYYFNYIKTLGCNIKSNIDTDKIEEIKSIYDNGITIWHFRDIATFKGINNFDYENIEIKGVTNGS